MMFEIMDRSARLAPFILSLSSPSPPFILALLIIQVAVLLHSTLEIVHT